MAHWYPLLLHPSAAFATHTHAKQATVSTASHIQLQMSPPWAPSPFDVMNNEDEFSFAQVSENYNAIVQVPHFKQSGLRAQESIHVQATDTHNPNLHITR